MFSKIRGLLLITAGVGLGFAISVTTTVLADRETGEKSLPWEEARLLAEVLERVKSDYVDAIDERALLEDAIRGMVSSLDPHSAFLNSEEFEEIRISTTGNYSGVGLEVSLVNGEVRVISPIDDTPAFHSGLEPGDVILAIDGETLDSESLNDTISKMRGEVGTVVSLRVRRDSVPEPLQFDLVRTRIQVASVKSSLLESDYGYVRITQFSETTGRDLQRAVENLHEANGRKLHGLILDLRNNPGGVLDAAVDVSDAFLNEGLIVSADGRVADARFAMEAHAGDLMAGGELIVLVNAGSASASEIVAGALKDHGRALVMGSVTYGKGSVQTVMPLSNGRAIKLTTSKYFTPSGVSIHERGITPDVTLQRDPDELQRVAGLPPPVTPQDLLANDSVLRTALGQLKKDDAAHIMQSKAR